VTVDGWDAVPIADAVSWDDGTIETTPAKFITAKKSSTRAGKKKKLMKKKRLDRFDKQ